MDRNIVFLCAILFTLLAIVLATPKKAKAATAPTFNTYNCVRAIIGEASNQGYQGMLAVACGLRNRGTLLGVYGLNAAHIDKEPEWVWQQAMQAWFESEKNLVHNGEYWGSIILDKKWIAEMERAGYCKVYEYKDHVFYTEGKA